MGLMTALNAAVTGLRTTQAGLDLVSQNIANANSVGYSRRVMSPVQQLAGERTAGVRTGEVERILDVIAQKQLRLERAGSAYTGFLSDYARKLDGLFGAPGEAGALDTMVNGFTQSLQALVADPGSTSARMAVLDQAGVLAGQIGRISESVQAMRTEAEGRIGLAVDRANELLSGISEVNARIVAKQSAADPALLDERDRLVDELSSLMDIHTSVNSTGAVSISTTAGVSLFNGVTPVRLAFDARASLAPQALFTGDPAARGVGTITAISANGVSTDVIANQMVRSGEIAAAIEMRDKTLVEAQRQLDELAAGLSRALSDRSVAGTPASTGGGTGVELDLAGWQAGNTLTLDVVQGGVARRITLVATLGNAPATIPAGDVGDPVALVVPVDISGGVGAAAGSIQSALQSRGFAIAVDSPSGSVLRFVDDGAAGTSDVRAGSGVVTATDVQSGPPSVPQLPLFVDGGDGKAFSGSFEGGSHLVGLAQRLVVNPALLGSPQSLVVYGSDVPAGDATRPQLLLDSLTKTARTFPAAAGVAGNAPFSSTVTGFARRVVETQGANAQTAARLDEGQSVALAAIESRFKESSGVNIDQEMAQLVQLQTAYGANARVMTAVRDMMDMLLRM